MYAHVHLVAIGQSALSRALVPVDIVEIGAHILFRLSSRDLHGLGPGAFAFADHERVTGMVSHLKHVLFVRLPHCTVPEILVWAERSVASASPAMHSAMVVKRIDTSGQEKLDSGSIAPP